MFISLTIENVDRLPNGGPISFSSNGRSFEIGRERRDWNLPDPNLFISGLHCQVQYDGGSFWLHDVSRNGTFVNGTSERLASPYRLCDGDRIWIGRYIVAVSIEDDRQADAVGAGEWASAPYHGGGDFGPSPAPQAVDPFFAPPAARPAPPARATPAAEARQISPAPQSTPARPQADATELLRLIAAGAGVAPEVFTQRDPQDVAAEIGSVLRAVVDELAQLLKARAAAKALAKSSHRTMIGGADNNPLKFIPRADEILEIMFARRHAGYLDARRSIEDAFRDLKSHEIATYAAMQAALSRLLSELSPEAMERKAPPSFVSKKGRAWDAYVATWEAKEDAHENGMLDVFLAYFAEAYAKSAGHK
ncbi:type VI secretion system-associated FHA domain protein TagH [Mesorhizobium sp. CC13]|uniref:type VI secretion system-associated FHA domain protein TagH n=1 Tax=Mesorhizobium sp. CC13 TaxID=3029194 RepID=UPI003266AE9C